MGLWARKMKNEYKKNPPAKGDFFYFGRPKPTTMLTTEEFVLQYEAYTDEELYKVYHNIDDYSSEAKDALEIVIKKKGGMEQFLDRMNEKATYAAEINRIGREVVTMSRKSVDVDFMRTIISSKILPPEKVNEIITQASGLVALEKEDKKIKPRTVVGSVLAVIVATAIGGTGWGLKEIYAPDIDLKIQLILLVGVVLICYGIVKKFTGQSKKNVVILIATILSVVLSIGLGWLIADMAILFRK